jgi:hypothetical protein
MRFRKGILVWSSAFMRLMSIGRLKAELQTKTQKTGAAAND